MHRKQSIIGIIQILLCLGFIVVLGAEFIQPNPARAASIVVDVGFDVNPPVNNDGCTLREAVENANDDALTHPDCDAGSASEVDVITFDGLSTVTVDKNYIFVDNPLVIDGGNSVTLDATGNTGNGFFTVASAASFKLTSITLQNSEVSAVLVQNGTLELENCTFKSNGANISQGGAVSSSHNVSITNCNFEDNQVTDNGGAIFITGTTTTLSILNSSFKNNSTTNTGISESGSGGAIYTSAGIVNITATAFDGNTATGVKTSSGGGAIYFAPGSGTTAANITASAFAGNKATGQDARGGAIHIGIGNNSGEAVAINYSHFGTTPIPLPAPFNSLTAANEVTGSGGVGGAIFIGPGKVGITGSSFFGNKSANHGGAIATESRDDSASFIANSTFFQNQATNFGGAVYQFAGSGVLRVTNLYNVTVSENMAFKGGGLYNGVGNSATNYLRLFNTLLANNIGGNCDNAAVDFVEFGHEMEDGAPNSNLVFNPDTCAGITPASTDSPNLLPPQLVYSPAAIMTYVLPLGPNSGAGGTGNNTVCSSFPVLGTDQTGTPAIRPLPMGTNCDIGAFESANATEIQVTQNGNGVTDGASNVDFGTTTTGDPVQVTFTITNIGQNTLTIGAFNPLPAGFALTTTPANSVSPGNNTTFVVECTAMSANTYSGTISFDTNDQDEDPFNFTVECDVNDPAPEIIVKHGNTSIADGGNFNFPSATTGTPEDVTFTVENTGTGSLTLTPPINLPPGFIVETPFGSTTVAANGGTTTFTVRCVAAMAGNYNGMLSFANDDSDENPYNFTINCDVNDPASPEINVLQSGNTIVDGGNFGFGTTNIGMPLDIVFNVENTGTGALTLIEPITVPSGFSIQSSFASTTVAAGGGITTFTIRCDATMAGNYTGSLSFANDDSNEDPYNFTITCDVTEPEIDVKENNVSIADGGNFNFGTTTTGMPVDATFTVENTGTGALTLVEPISLPAGFSIQTSFGSTTVVANGGTTTFTIRCDAAMSGNATGMLSFANNDVNENPYNFTISCSVSDPAPEIDVKENNVSIADGGNFNFGTTTTGTLVDATFTVENTGTAALTVVEPITVPSGFSIQSSFASTTVAAGGGTTTFTIRCDATMAGNYTGMLSFANSDSDENPYNFTVNCDVNPPLSPEIDVKENNVSIADGSNFNFGATFTGTPVNITFTVENTGTGALTLVEPITVPSGFSIQSSFASTTVAAGGGTTTFIIRCDATMAGNYSGMLSFGNNDGNENPYDFTVTCDVSNPPVAPEIDVKENNVSIADGGNFNFGTTTTGTPLPVTFTVENTGTGALTLVEPISVPAGFSVLNSFGSTTVAAGGGTTTFTVRCDATMVGNYSGMLSFGNNDGNENPYDFTVNCDVNAPLTPEIDVKESNVSIADGSNFNFGTTTTGTPLPVTFTVENTGTGALTLVEPISVPAGFSVLNSFGSTTVAAGGGTTTFTVRCDATMAGNYSGMLSFGNNDGNENPYDFTVNCDVNAPLTPEIDVKENNVSIADGSNFNFSTTNTGTPVDVTFTVENTGTGALTLVEPISVPAGFSVLNSFGSTTVAAGGGTTTFTVRCDATMAGNYSGMLSFGNNDGNENPYDFTVSCAVNNPLTTPEINVRQGVVTIADNGTFDFGTTNTGTPLNVTFTVENAGTGLLTLVEPISVPAGFSVQSSFGSTNVAAGGTTTFTVRCDAAAAGTYSGVLSFGNDDSDENPYNFTVNCSVISTTTAPSPFNLVAPADTITGVTTFQWQDTLATSPGLTFDITVNHTGAAPAPVMVLTAQTRNADADGVSCDGSLCTLTLNVAEQALFTNGSYEWRVTAHNGSGSTSASNEPLNFTILVNGDLIRDGSFEIQGIAVADAAQWTESASNGESAPSRKVRRVCDPAIAIVGTCALRFQVKGLDNVIYKAAQSRNANFVNDADVLNLNAQVRGNNLTRPVRLRVKVFYDDLSKGKINLNSQIGSFAYTPFSSTYTVTGQVTRIKVMIMVGPGASGKAYVDDVHLFWTPN